MTVKDENTYAAFQYNVLKPVEFYEFIGRLANEKFRGTDLTLTDKLEMTLDLIFPRFGLVRQEVKEDETKQEEKESVDSFKVDDVDEENYMLLNEDEEDDYMKMTLM